MRKLLANGNSLAMDETGFFRELKTDSTRPTLQLAGKRTRGRVSSGGEQQSPPGKRTLTLERGDF